MRALVFAFRVVVAGGLTSLEQMSPYVAGHSGGATSHGVNVVPRLSVAGRSGAQSAFPGGVVHVHGLRTMQIWASGSIRADSRVKHQVVENLESPYVAGLIVVA